jgi:hypothetical protein
MVEEVGGRTRGREGDRFTDFRDLVHVKLYLRRLQLRKVGEVWCERGGWEER